MVTAFAILAMFTLMALIMKNAMNVKRAMNIWTRISFIIMGLIMKKAMNIWRRLSFHIHSSFHNQSHESEKSHEYMNKNLVHIFMALFTLMAPIMKSSWMWKEQQIYEQKSLQYYATNTVAIFWSANIDIYYIFNI